jgi:hypothetical protein
VDAGGGVPNPDLFERHHLGFGVGLGLGREGDGFERGATGGTEGREGDGLGLRAMG